MTNHAAEARSRRRNKLVHEMAMSIARHAGEWEAEPPESTRLPGLPWHLAERLADELLEREDRMRASMSPWSPSVEARNAK